MLGGLGAGGGEQPICVIGLRTAQLRFIPANLFCIVLYAFNLRIWRKAEISGPASPKMPRPRSNISRPVQSQRARWVRAELFNRRLQSGTDGEEAADGRKCGGNPAGGPGRDRYTVQGSIRWLSRPDVMRGPRFTSTGPVQEPSPLASLVSRLGPAVLWASAEPVRWVQGELLKFRPLDFGPDKDDAVPMVRKADAREMRGRPSRYTVQPPMNLTRPDVMRGPRFCSTAPRQDPLLLIHQISLWAGHSVETSAEHVRWVRAEFFNPSPAGRDRRSAIGIHGAEHEITVPVVVKLEAEHWSASAHFTVPDAKWGMKNPSVVFLRVGDSVDIEFQGTGGVKPVAP
jgi:hypothetical protein